MGAYNSSVTRVWPVFNWLLEHDATGASWLPQLLKLGSRAREADPAIPFNPGALLPHLARLERDRPGPLRKALGPELAARVGHIRTCYEEELAPPEAFLRWTLANPRRLKWPEERPGTRREFGDGTQRKREAFLEGQPGVREEGLAELVRCGAGGSRRKWWAFEGFTSVDCYLETESLVLLIEGKRCEPISAATDWYPLRNQVIRNLEVAQAVAAREQKNFAVLLCAEKCDGRLELSEASWAQSLPHFSSAQITELRRHYLGCAEWKTIAAQLCSNLQLPDDIDGALKPA